MSVKLWCMSYSGAVAEYVDRLSDAEPPAFELKNLREIRGYLDSLGTVAGPYWRHHVLSTDLSGMPRPRLRITDPAFDISLFNRGLNFVSARLAQVLGLGDDVIQYIDADCSECSEPVRAKGYRVINPRVFANPMDRQRMSGVFIDVPRPDGSITHIWKPDLPHPARPAPPIYWRQDFVPPAPLFSVPGAQWTLVTDALADQVMRAGFPDVTFIDYAQAGVVYRSATD
ncbi:hypothetical protein GXW71_31500 [Roseomonas hellenica]|uniref:Uncharacterized protein n=1 Tax=Plastoroseomonas hellenica TaxID=2687306 RepID=A0ABS5F913_9PROT|nr:hypothetical protein [Plastoroseomonas hellenica]MBR0668918.1 hypothetical protein [Plastoroseomonas hellenica]